jgi:hypothetical protein
MSGLSRRDFEDLWARLDAEAQAAKFSHEALLRLTEFYRRLDQEDRRVVDEVLASWVLEGDERRRFDALALIDEFEIRSALPALQGHLARLADAVGPSVPTDRAKLERMIAHLQ